MRTCDFHNFICSCILYNFWKLYVYKRYKKTVWEHCIFVGFFIISVNKVKNCLQILVNLSSLKSVHSFSLQRCAWIKGPPLQQATELFPWTLMNVGELKCIIRWNLKNGNEVLNYESSNNKVRYLLVKCFLAGGDVLNISGKECFCKICVCWLA